LLALQKTINFLVWWKIAKIIGSEEKEGLLPSYFEKNIGTMGLDLYFFWRFEDLKTWRLEDKKIEDSCVVACGLLFPANFGGSMFFYCYF